MFILKQENYCQEEIDAAVDRIFRFFGGAPRFIAPGARVLLKVNLVSGHSPERRVTTDPSIVRAVAKVVLKAGGKPFIADSPGIDSFMGAARKAGFLDVASELGIPCFELTDPVPLPTSPDASFHKIEVSRQALEADVLINLPKMKTHGQMLLTLGVKNLFGCIVGQRKASWHYDVGLDRDRFASLLLDLYQGLSPALTLIDGVIGMDGAGPTSGNPYPYGILAAAQDALTMDLWLARMMGVQPDEYPLWRAARQKGRIQNELDPGDLAGDLTPEHRFAGLQLPRQKSLGFLPEIPFLSGLEKALTSRPVHVPELCIGCGRCQSVCAAGALTHRERTVTIDYKKCIRCYCCHEMCPVRAIAFSESPLVRFMNLISRFRARLFGLRKKP